jgi:hypothetical protein
VLAGACAEEGRLAPVRAGADGIITVQSPNLAVIRKTIRMLTGRTIRNLLPGDVEGSSSAT